MYLAGYTQLLQLLFENNSVAELYWLSLHQKLLASIFPKEAFSSGSSLFWIDSFLKASGRAPSHVSGLVFDGLLARGRSSYMMAHLNWDASSKWTEMHLLTSLK